MTELTQKRLKDILRYDRHSGLFTNIKNRKHVKIGAEAGCLDKKNGYILISIAGRNYRRSRLAWLYETGSMPDGEIDHVNHIKTDDRFCNLRDVSTKENGRNKSMSICNSTGFTGVGWYSLSNRWRARITVDGKEILLGYFVDKDDAIKAREKANVRYGFHKNHGAKS